ncbi:MAG: hypothetical protein FWF49_04105 [Oscillospiraceae bacterium]|nr:hypothetical protein [Oscillospiraceae bacterium]
MAQMKKRTRPLVLWAGLLVAVMLICLLCLARCSASPQQTTLSPMGSGDLHDAMWAWWETY